MNHGRSKHGAAPDLGPIKFRSTWERNCARVFNLRIARGELKGWEYEPQVFTFTGVTRGAVCYLPDFKLTYPDGSVEWVEVKGRETSRDRTKWRRLRQQYPEVKLTVIGAQEYAALKSRYAAIPHWEG